MVTLLIIFFTVWICILYLICRYLCCNFENEIIEPEPIQIPIEHYMNVAGRQVIIGVN
jgi:hypothetical protein